jgi:hypothetical protein
VFNKSNKSFNSSGRQSLVGWALILYYVLLPASFAIREHRCGAEGAFDSTCGLGPDALMTVVIFFKEHTLAVVTVHVFIFVLTFVCQMVSHR